MRILATLFVISLVSFSAIAAVQTEQEVTTQIEQPTDSMSAPIGLWPFFGLGAGVSLYDVNNERDGIPAQIKLLGSYYMLTQPYVIDMSLGVQNHRFTSDSRKENDSMAGLIDLAARYRFANAWQMGPAASFVLGNGKDLLSNSDDVTSFIGAQALKEWATSSNIFRLGGKIMTDLSITDRTNTVALIEFQVSLGGRRIARNDSPAPMPIVASAPQGPVTTLHLSPLSFETGKSGLKRTQAQKIQALAAELAKHPGLVQKITIYGHADIRGTKQTNNILSHSRAESAKVAMAHGGISPTIIETEAFGSSQPAKPGRTPAALSANRRVEIQFQGVTDQALLNQILKTVE